MIEAESPQAPRFGGVGDMGKLAVGCVAILVILAVIVGISFAGTYNRLVTLNQDVDRSWSEVENQYQRRADLVPNLVATVQGAANFEKETLTAVTEARASVGRATVTPGKAPTDPESMSVAEYITKHGLYTSGTTKR